jgi:hypothetical protein
MRYELNRHMHEKKFQLSQLVYNSESDDDDDDGSKLSTSNQCNNSFNNCFLLDTLQKTLVNRMKVAKVNQELLADSQFFFREKERIKRNKARGEDE